MPDIEPVLEVDHFKTPLGDMVLIARAGVLLLLEFAETKHRYMAEMQRRYGQAKMHSVQNPFGLSDVMNAYFEGDLHAIDHLKTDGGGTGFERQVWAELRKIPCGSTLSYGDIARKLGDVQLSRAVGTANGKNPIAIVVPCHRVIGSNGSLTGYASGLKRKEWLLKHEGALLI